MATKTDPLDTMKAAARAMEGAVEGQSCSQASFKAGGKAFFYAGEQGGRCKAMFRLKASLDDAEAMASDSPDEVQVGNQGWVTARFDPGKPLAARVWKKWLKESHALATGG